MKKLIFISSLLLFLSCATTHMGNLSLVSTKEVDMGAYYIKVAENYEGRAIMNIIQTALIFIIISLASQIMLELMIYMKEQI